MDDITVLETPKKIIKPKITNKSKNEEIIENAVINEILNESNKKKHNRPKVSDMVDHALNSLYHKKGCSLPAIKKHIALTFECDEKTMKRITPKIRNHILENIEKNNLLKLSGKGITGYFKLSKNPKHVDKIKKVKNKETKNEAKNKKGNKEIKNKEGMSKDVKDTEIKSKKVEGKKVKAKEKSKEVKTKKDKSKEVKPKKDKSKVGKQELTSNQILEEKPKIEKKVTTMRVTKIKDNVNQDKNISHKKTKISKKRSLGVVVARKSIHTPKSKIKRTTSKNEDSKKKVRESKRTKTNLEKSE